jgi:hypothetical protein
MVGFANNFAGLRIEPKKSKDALKSFEARFCIKVLNPKLILKR